MTRIHVRSLGSSTTFLISICFFLVGTFEIRLRGGLSNTLGRVEVNLNDGYGWGTVCDDDWDVDDAKVACRSLGLPYRYAIPVSNAGFGEGTGSTHMDNVGCTGSESSLRYCTYLNRTRENCQHSEDAGVVCWVSTFSNYKNLYIANSDSSLTHPLDGMLMLNYTNRKFVVGICNDQFRNEEARVACSELGFERNLSHVLWTDTYDKSIASFLWIKFKCDGTERRLSSCSITREYGRCPNAQSRNPSIVCNYQYVKSVQLFGNMVSRQMVSMNIDKVYTVNCVTDFSRPRTKVTWVIDDHIERIGVQNSIEVSGSLYRTKSSLTISANASQHGKIIKCCSEDPIGYKICSSHFTLTVNVYPTIETMAIYHIRRNSTNKTGDKFLCISERSRPEPTLDWYHNGVQIKDSKMIEENSKILKDGTHRKTSTLVFPFHESLTGSNIIECKVSIESHFNMISVPYFIRRDDGTKDPKYLQADKGESEGSIGNIIIYVCLCGVIIILSVTILCMSLIFCRRNLNPGGADRTRPAGRNYTPRENEAYTGPQYELENYEQLSPTPVGSLGKIGESVYENTRTS